jgi:hypothetical protein
MTQNLKDQASYFAAADKPFKARMAWADAFWCRGPIGRPEEQVLVAHATAACYLPYGPTGGTQMKLPRRRFLHLAAGAAALPAVSRRVAGAQAYPTRPVRVMVGFAPGQAIDIVTRIIGQRLSERLGQQFIIENRPGAGGNIATEVVARAPADGYTLLAIGSNNMINATLYQSLNYDFLRDIAPVASVYRVPQVMEVNPSFPAKTVPDFIAYAKAHPGEISFASAGNGSVAHVTGELFKMMTGVNMLHVPYRGAPPALTDLIAGQVHVISPASPVGARIARTPLQSLTASSSLTARLCRRIGPRR